VPKSGYIFVVAFDGSSEQNPSLPRWVEMKCNSLVYLKQIMKYNRKKKMQQMKDTTPEEDKEQEGLVKKDTIDKEVEAKEKDNNDVTKGKSYGFDLENSDAYEF
jgi:ribosomal protein L39E